MKWKNLSISVKLGIGFGFILILTAIVGLLSVSGIVKIIRGAGQYEDVGHVRSAISDAEISHLGWAKKVTAFLADDEVTELKVKTDDHACTFGKWLYGDERKHAEELVPSIASYLKKVESFHHDLHVSAIEIKKHFRPADPQLPQFVAERQADHHLFVSKIQAVFASQGSSFNVQTDPQACKLGKWLYGEGAQNAIKLDPELKTIIDTIIAPHTVLHESVKDIQNTWDIDDYVAQADAEDIFTTVTLPALHKVEDSLAAMKKKAVDNMAGFNKANEVYLTVSAPAIDKVTGILSDLHHELDEKMAEEESNFNNQAVQTRQLVTVISLVAILAGLIISLLLGRKISGPLVEGVAFAQKIADGDLSTTLPLDQQDEVGKLVTALNNMAEKLRGIMLDISEKSNKAAASSEELYATSEEMASGASTLVNQAESSAASTEEISANIQGISSTAELMSSNANTISSSAVEMSSNVNNVAAAMEEMSVSIKEVAENCTSAQKFSGNAKDKSDSSRVMINELDKAAKDIGNVVNVITEITEQTKLLALNATIEAARAGEAGKGFAVVANEVKDLAKQTAEATESIVSQVKDMQSRTTSVVQVIEDISVISEELNQINTTIAAAVEEQTATIGDVARTITGTAQGVTEVSTSIQDLSANIEQEIIVSIKEVAGGAEEISSNIHGVNSVANESAQGASVISSSSGELANLAAELQAQVDQFKLN